MGKTNRHYSYWTSASYEPLQVVRRKMGEKTSGHGIHTLGVYGSCWLGVWGVEDRDFLDSGL